MLYKFITHVPFVIYIHSGNHPFVVIMKNIKKNTMKFEQVKFFRLEVLLAVVVI
jgi:hypothetical protein